MTKLDFTTNDWNQLHDAIYHITSQQLNQSQLEEVFNSLPIELEMEAYTFGMNDSLWKDRFISYYKQLKNK